MLSSGASGKIPTSVLLHARPMTRSELVFLLAQRFPQFVQADCHVAVTAILDCMSHTLVKGGRVEIRGFGTFALNYRPPRIGRNPKTGDKVAVPEKWSPHFRAGKELREAVDQSYLTAR